VLAQGHIYPTNLLCKSGFTNSDRPQLEICSQISESPGYMARRSTTLCRCRYVACRGPALSESSGRSGVIITSRRTPFIMEDPPTFKYVLLSDLNYTIFANQCWLVIGSIYMISWCAKISTLPKASTSAPSFTIKGCPCFSDENASLGLVATLDVEQ